MNLIRDLKTDENSWFTTGRFDSSDFLPGETGIMIFTDDGATLEDAEKCIDHYNSLSSQPDLIDSVERGLKKFFLYMYDEWAAMGIYPRITESLKPVKEACGRGTLLSSFLTEPTLLVYPQQNGETGYGIECGCPWEPEHQCLILIKDHECVYTGSSEMLDPWSDEKYLHCVWDD